LFQAKVNQQKNASLGKSNTISKEEADIEGAADNLRKAAAARGGGASTAASSVTSTAAKQIEKKLKEEEEK